jgi:hypothetical protein
MNRLDELKKISREVHQDNYLDTIYTYGLLAAKKGKTTFLVQLSDLVDKDLDRNGSITFSNYICNLLRDEGFVKYEIEWTHPDCFLYQYCEKGCKPERIKICIE